MGEPVAFFEVSSPNHGPAQRFHAALADRQVGRRA
jgi:hypothetical protein